MRAENMDSQTLKGASQSLPFVLPARGFGKYPIPQRTEMVAMENARPIRRALISVSDKTGIVEFAQALAQRDVEILSTGGTARSWLKKAFRLSKFPNTPASLK